MEGILPVSPESSETYRPQLPRKDWDAIKPYVLDIVDRAEPHVTYTERQLLTPVSHLVHFAYVNHIPLEDGAALSPRTVERFVQNHLASYNRASRNTIRARLRRVSEALLGDDAAGRFRALGKADASRPYSDTDISLLRAWGRSMRTDELTSSAGALLALGLGAGLTGAEIIRQRMEDVDVERATIHVTGENERVIPITGEVWTDLLRIRREVLGGTGWVFRAHQRGDNINLITDFVSRTSPQIPLVTRRMRATWLVHHLNAGTPLRRLLRIAGLQSAEALDRILPFTADD
jgi:integrase